MAGHLREIAGWDPDRRSFFVPDGQQILECFRPWLRGPPGVRLDPPPMADTPQSRRSKVREIDAWVDALTGESAAETAQDRHAEAERRVAYVHPYLTPCTPFATCYARACCTARLSSVSTGGYRTRSVLGLRGFAIGPFPQRVGFHAFWCRLMQTWNHTRRFKPVIVPAQQSAIRLSAYKLDWAVVFAASWAFESTHTENFHANSPWRGASPSTTKRFISLNKPSSFSVLVSDNLISCPA